MKEPHATPPLGRSGLSVAPLMLGTNVFGWNVDEPTAFAILDAFVDAGFNAIDTANSIRAGCPATAAVSPKRSSVNG